MQPLYEFGGDGPVMHIAPANGFPPQTYIPLVRHFTDAYRVLCLPPRSLWPDERPPEQRIYWHKLIATDLLDGLRAHNLTDVIAVGHSFGGVASLIAAEREPERFRALILLDPTILPGFIMRMLQTLRVLRMRTFGTNMADRAEKRRNDFQSREEAYDYFKGRRLFAAWPEETLRLYVDSMLPDENGGVKLAWPPAWESYVFHTFYAGTWRHVPGVRGKVPVLIVRGGASDTYRPDAVKQMARALPEAAAREVPGHGHLFPLEAPDATASVILEWLKEVK